MNRSDLFFGLRRKMKNELQRYGVTVYFDESGSVEHFVHHYGSSDKTVIEVEQGTGKTTLLAERIKFALEKRFKTKARQAFEENHPPRIGQFVLLLLPKKNREHLIGDLEEEYRTKVSPEYGHVSARVWYWAQTIQALGSYLWPLLTRILGLAVVWRVTRR